MSDPFIKIEANFSDAEHKLKNIPGAATAAIKSSIRRGLSAARSQIVKSIRKTYTLPAAYLRNSIGRARISNIDSALSGNMTVSSARVPLYLFPHKTVPGGGGVQFEELKGHTSILRHAFGKELGGGSKFPIVTRAGAGAPRFPLYLLKGLAVPQMLPRNEKEIMEETERQMMRQLNSVIDGFLSGKLQMRHGRISAAEQEE
jgi:hypothetical protein